MLVRVYKQNFYSNQDKVFLKHILGVNLQRAKLFDCLPLFLQRDSVKGKRSVFRSKNNLISVKVKWNNFIRYRKTLYEASKTEVRPGHASHVPLRLLPFIYLSVRTRGILLKEFWGLMLNYIRDTSTEYEHLKNLLIRKKGRGNLKIQEERKKYRMTLRVW